MQSIFFIYSPVMKNQNAGIITEISLIGMFFISHEGLIFLDLTSSYGIIGRFFDI